MNNVLILFPLKRIRKFKAPIAAGAFSFGVETLIKQSIISILIGAALFSGLHFFIGMLWIKEGSLDILFGAILDFFFTALLINIWNIKQEKMWKKELDAHLDKIEALIKRAYASIKDIDGK